MTDYSPKARSLNKSMALERAVSLNDESSSDSEDEKENDRQIKLPNIVLNKLHTNIAAMPFNNIPGLKTKPNKELIFKRAMSEKKQKHRDSSVEVKDKKNILNQSALTKRTKNRLGVKVMESWIDDTLEEAEHFDIPGVIIKPKQK